MPDLSKMDTVLCIDALSRLAKASGYKIWIMLDIWMLSLRDGLQKKRERSAHY